MTKNTREENVKENGEFTEKFEKEWEAHVKVTEVKQDKA